MLKGWWKNSPKKKRKRGVVHTKKRDRKRGLKKMVESTETSTKLLGNYLWKSTKMKRNGGQGREGTSEVKAS